MIESSRSLIRTLNPPFNRFRENIKKLNISVLHKNKKPTAFDVWQKIYNISDRRCDKEINKLNSFYFKNNLEGNFIGYIVDFDPTQPYANADLSRPEENEEIEEEQDLLESENGKIYIFCIKIWYIYRIFEEWQSLSDYYEYFKKIQDKGKFKMEISNKDSK